jgi:ABC-2 type transport system ATP-binding protein
LFFSKKIHIFIVYFVHKVNISMLLEVNLLRKTYATGFEAVKGISLQVNKGEIVALLGPNGAGKTTLISTICGITTPSSGSVFIGGHDISRNFREARKLVGLVPQEITLEPFEKVINTIKFSRGLFGKKKDDALIEKILTKLSLWDKRDSRIMELSGGMKRRVLIAKALSHEPRLLFLDEPTAGVDVELRQSMWNVVADLKADGVTIILTTHYIEEAEAIADRVGVINKGELLLMEDKASLMQRLGQKVLKIELHKKLDKIPNELIDRNVELSKDGLSLTYVYDTKQKRTGITKLLSELAKSGINLRDIQTDQSSLEEIFVNLVKE